MKRERKLCLAVFVSVLLLYLSEPSAFYNFDGVACAIAVELGDWRHLAHGNHLAYGLIGWAFDRLWRLLGYSGAAIVPLNALSGALGAATTAVFCSTLLRLGFRRSTAILCAAGLALSQAFWFWSLEAQVYPLGTLFLALAAREALSDKPRPSTLGLWHAGAVLGHVGHVMFTPAALYLLWRRGHSRRRALTYAASLAGMVAAAYALAALFLVKPRSAAEVRLWLLGSAALKVDGSFTWYGGYSPADALEWLKMTARIFCEPAGTGASRALGWALGGLAAAAALVGAAAQPRQVSRACLLWIAGYALLFASWQPFTAVYRISDLLALWLLTALAVDAKAVEAVPGSKEEKRWSLAPTEVALAFWLAVAGAYNLRTEILPRSNPANNAAYQEALWIGRDTPPRAWIVVSGLGQVYVPYFAHRRPLNLRYFETRLADLPARLDALARADQPAYATSTTLASGPWRGTLEAYGLVETARADGTTLYELKRRGIRAARAGKN